NGRRLPPGSPNSPGANPVGAAADLNQIPAPLIKRVEVLTGGASAVYGSDAVAGVVNFIMNDSFQGVQIEVNESVSNHSQSGGPVADASRRLNYKLPGNIGADAKIKDVSLTIGGNFDGDKGNAVVYFGYKKEDALLESQRDFTACALTGFTQGNTFNCGGSGTSYPGRFILKSGQKTVADANGGVRPYVAATDQYNYAPLNYLQRPSERYSFSSFTHYDFNDKARLYTEASFHDDRTVAQVAPSGLFGFDASGTKAIHYENPFLSQAWKDALGLTAPGQTADALIFRRNVEGGGRQSDMHHTSYRGVLGMKGDIGDWKYDVFAQLGRVNYVESLNNDLSTTRITRAMDAVSDVNGNTVCRAKLNGTDPNCVPYNIWAIGGVTPAVLNYLQTPGYKQGMTSQSVQGLNLSSDLGAYGLKLPTAQSGIGVAFGAEHRTEKLELRTDAAFDTFDLAGQLGPIHGVNGSFSVKEYYGEVRVPLIEKLPFANLLSVNGSYRKSDYSTGQSTDSYGFGAEWSPVSMARFRASYQRAVRAPNVIEMFTPQGKSVFQMSTDPCAGAKPSASFAACANTGVTAAQYGTILDSPSQQYNYLVGGNPNLAPESSDSYTLGLVLTPLRNLSITLDAFNMKVEGVIGPLPPQTTLTQCLSTGDPKFCSLVTRDRLGSLWALPAGSIVAVRQNLGMKKTSGLDVGANYSHKLGAMGVLDVGFTGTYLKSFSAEDYAGSLSYDCAGLYGTTCGVPLPKWRHKLRGTWSTPWKLDLALTWRHIDSTEIDRSSSNRVLSGAFQAADEVLGKRDYLDVAVNWQISKNYALRGGVNNLLDKDPPVTGVLGNFGNGNNYPQVYDSMGRRLFMNLTAKF
ncbi:MAG: TonB-dependent receptor, partial [Frankiales bacterium]|nr:TonB-dependent receptor [Frankiales bacterium]